MAGCISESDEDIGDLEPEGSISLGIAPYNYEPVFSDSDTDVLSSESDPSDDEDDRTSNTMWYSM